MLAAQSMQMCPKTAPMSALPRLPLRRALAVRVGAGKGFGSSQQKKPKKQAEEGPAVPGQRTDRVKTVKFKGKRTMRQGPQSQPAQQYAQSGGGAQPGFNVLDGAPGAEAGSEGLVEKIEFEQRLKALQLETEERQKEQQRAAASGGGILDASPLDGPAAADVDIYANVQPLSKTLLPRDDSSAAKEYEGSQFGPSQAGLAVAAVLLGAVFLLTSGAGDIAPTQRPQSSAVAQQAGGAQQVGEEQRAELEQQLATFKQQLAADGGDLEALEGAAVITARLGQYPEAEKLLAKLAAAKPGDADVLRVLGETQAAQGQWAAATASYRRAWEASGQSSLEVLQGLAATLVADGKEAAAIEAIQAAQAPGGSSIGEAELQLLAGRTYAQWRGHVPDALAVYDALIESRPEDFRAYLAKGLLLKDNGREGDAARYFIQARYYAKDNRKLVDAIIDSRQ